MPDTEHDAPLPPPPPPRARDAVLASHRVVRGGDQRRAPVRLDLGECAAPASPAVLDAVRGASPADLASYPDEEPFVEAVTALHGVPREQVVVSSGTDAAIRWTFQAFVEEGSRVVLPRPSFGAFLAAADTAGAFVERLNCRADLNFHVEDFDPLLAPRTPRLVVLANPNAPTGGALTEEAIVELTGRSPSSLFLVDEVYGAFHGRSLLDLPQRPANLLVLRGFSKSHGLAGLRIGYCVGHPDVVSAIARVRPTYAVGALALRAGRAALRDAGSVERLVADTRARMDKLVERLATRGVEARSTQANFVLVRLTSPVQPWAAGFAAHGLLVGSRGHGGPLAGWIRVTPSSDEAVDRFLEVLDLLRAQGLGAATWVDGVPGEWGEMSEEGMA